MIESSFMKMYFDASNWNGIQLIFLGCISEITNLLHEF